MSVFKVDQALNVALDDQALRLIPELVSLTQDELKYVILVVDYVDSPLRKKPLAERKMMAKRMVFKGKNVQPETQKVLKAMDLYKSLVFDIRRETVDIYSEKIRKLQKETLHPDTTFARMKEIDQTITFMQNRVTSIQHELDIEEGERLELQGNRKLSYIEIWQRRQKEYAEYKKGM